MCGLTQAFTEKMLTGIPFLQQSPALCSGRKIGGPLIFPSGWGLTNGGQSLGWDSWGFLPPEDKTFPGANALAEQPQNDQKSSDVGQILETQQLLETSLLDASMYFVIDSSAAGGGHHHLYFCQAVPREQHHPSRVTGSWAFLPLPFP